MMQSLCNSGRNVPHHLRKLLLVLILCVPEPQNAFILTRSITNIGSASRHGANLCPLPAGRFKSAPLSASAKSRTSRIPVFASSIEGPATPTPNFEDIKNVRDLANVSNSPIKPGRLIRAACVGTASEKDKEVILSTVKTLVDLRSEHETEGDLIKYNSTVFDAYDSLLYKVKRSKSGRPKAVVPMTDPVGSQRSRHLLSVIDEGIYKRGVFKRLGLRKKLKVSAYMAFNYGKARQVFLDYINDAGLPLLNELILDYGGPSVKAVLEVLADRNSHPVAFYCTAGKDRTGLIAMLVLSFLGVDEESIVNDYALSDSVYADLDDKDAMVGALKQEKLDPAKFLRAPKFVMQATIELLNTEYGGVVGYMDKIGFNAEDRARLRSALCED